MMIPSKEGLVTVVIESNDGLYISFWISGDAAAASVGVAVVDVVLSGDVDERRRLLLLKLKLKKAGGGRVLRK
jgi:hypothetical protein